MLYNHFRLLITYYTNLCDAVGAVRSENAAPDRDKVALQDEHIRQCA